MIRVGSMSIQTLVGSLDESVPKLMEDATVPGLAISLVWKDSIVWSQAFGVRNSVTQEPVTLNTLFEAASRSMIQLPGTRTGPNQSSSLTNL